MFVVARFPFCLLGLPRLPEEESIISVFEAGGIVDRSCLGKLRVTGQDRLDLLHRLSTNDLLHLKAFSSRGTVFTTDKGRIVEYARVVAYPDSLLLISWSNQVERLNNWIEKYTITEDIQSQVVTDSEILFTLIGPECFQDFSTITGQLPPAGEIRVTRYENIPLSVDHQIEFGVDWVNILAPSDHATMLRSRLDELSLEHGVPSIDERTFEYYRILHGIPGKSELSEAFNPYDVNLRHAISYTKGCYIGQEVIARLDTYQKVQKGLGLLSFGEAIRFPTESALPISAIGKQVGVLTSSSEAALGGTYLGLGVLKKSEVTVGEGVTIDLGPRILDAHIERIF